MEAGTDQKDASEQVVNSDEETHHAKAFPEIRQTGKIPRSYDFDRLQGRWPAYFYAPSDGLTDINCVSIVPSEFMLSQINKAASMFIRDHIDGVNILYSHDPSICCYRDKTEIWTWKRKPEVPHWVLHDPVSPIDTQDIRSKIQSRSSETGLRRMVLLEGLEYQIHGVNLGSVWPHSFTFYQGWEDHYISFGSTQINALQLKWYTQDWKSHSLTEAQSLPRDPRFKWPDGSLYGADNPACRLLGMVFTVVIYCEKNEGSLKDKKHWTCAINLPSKTLKRGNFQDLLHEPLLDLPLVYATVVSLAIKLIISDWQMLLKYMERLVGADSAILNPEEHDRLLFDDEQYSRSRLYFWELNSLQTFIPVMKESREICVLFMEFTRSQYTDQEYSLLSAREQLVLKDFQEQINSWDQTMKRAWALSRRVVLLRDGLFNASAVLESRASTRLGENVKLLTYVSVFYLPLAFCTSLWSVSDTFSFVGLGVTMTLVALLTYLITFNLNQTVSVSRSIYNKGRDPLVESMRDWQSVPSLRHEYWEAQSRKFRSFQPPRAQRQPSEWLLLQFLVERTFYRLTLLLSWRGWRISQWLRGSSTGKQKHDGSQGNYSRSSQVGGYPEDLHHCDTGNETNVSEQEMQERYQNTAATPQRSFSSIVEPAVNTDQASEQPIHAHLARSGSDEGAASTETFRRKARVDEEPDLEAGTELRPRKTGTM